MRDLVAKPCWELWMGFLCDGRVKRLDEFQDEER